MRCGLLGEHLSHSYSPLIHSYWGEYTYELFDKKPEELDLFLKSGEFLGINVTAPYKKAVIPYCSQLTQEAKRLGAVNTIVQTNDGLIGHNTDFFGFSYMLKKSGLQVCGKKVLVLGSGGAAAAVLGVLSDAGANAINISRKGDQNYGNLHNHQDARIIVNATPVGMYPNTGFSPLNLRQFPHLEGVLDVIYNPARTQLLMDAEELGIPTMNGLWMLVAQAKEAAEWFSSKNIHEEQIEAVYSALCQRLQNIVLIGMPGCGKSLIGKSLATLTGKTFVDTDLLIEAQAGKKIADIFREDGEIFFRNLETQVIQEVGKKSGLVIATGGGCVCRPENYQLLHQNGAIVWLQRNIELLETTGRPLSQCTELSQMYEVRKTLYEQFADHKVMNDSTPEHAAQQITALEVRK